MSAVDGQFPGLRAWLPRAGEGRLRRAVLIFAAGFVPFLAADTALAELPSGQAVTMLDRTLEDQDDGATWLVLRYHAPRISGVTGDLGYDDVLDDLDTLCRTDGFPAAQDVGGVEQVVVVLLAEPLERGASDPNVRKYIGAYEVGVAGCVPI